MARGSLILGGVVALAVAGCSHDRDLAGAHGIGEGIAGGFGQTVVVAERGAETSRTPTPIAWGQPEVIRHHGQVQGPVVVEAVRGPRAVAAEDGPYLLDTGDRLRIFVYGQPSLSRLYTVDHGGQISVPLIGHVHARGNTTRGLENAIKSRLGAQYVKDPHVTVDVFQNRPFYILGEVRSAGQYTYVSGMTVQSAVAIAGGYSERADERQFMITRRVDGVVEKIEVPADYVLLPGDTVYVKERWF